MGGTDKTILIAFAIAVLLATAGAVAVWRSTLRKQALDVHRAEAFEKKWLVIVAVGLVALLAATLWFTPYGQSTPTNAQIVHVTAQQFFWQIEPSTVQADRPVAFVTTSKDVNHGFGLYRGNKLLAQIQVVPDKSSTLIHTFHEPGTYQVLCLEFCGLDHHKMVARITVER